MSQEPEMNEECDREDLSLYSGLPFMQKYEEMWIKQGKLEWKNNLKLITNELKQKFGEICEKYKITACPKEEPLYENAKGVNLKEMSSNSTNNVLDHEEKDAFGMSVSVVLQAFPEQREPSLENVFPSHLYSGSQEYTCQSSSKLYLNDNKLDCENYYEPDTEHIFNKNEESFYGAENQNERNPDVVAVEVKEDQEFDMQMTKNANQNTKNWKLDIGHVHQSNDTQSLFDLWLTRSSEMKHMIQTKKHSLSADTSTYEKTKPMQVLFQKPLHNNCSTNNYKTMEPELENVSSSPLYSDKTSKVYLNEELQQDMQRFKNEIGMLQVEFRSLEKEKVQLQKEVEVHLLLLFVVLLINYLIRFDFLLIKSLCIKWVV